MEVVTGHQATTHRSRPSARPADGNTWGHCATPMRCWSRWQQPTPQGTVGSEAGRPGRTGRPGADHGRSPACSVSVSDVVMTGEGSRPLGTAEVTAGQGVAEMGFRLPGTTVEGGVGAGDPGQRAAPFTNATSAPVIGSGSPGQQRSERQSDSGATHAKREGAKRGPEPDCADPYKKPARESLGNRGTSTL
jgi:hypothetical protein